jgi:hypothetical protein
MHEHMFAAGSDGSAYDALRARVGELGTAKRS